MKKKNTAKNIWLGVIIFVALIIVVYLIAPANLQKFTNNKIEYSRNGINQTTSFESKYLEFSVNLPVGFQAVDETSRITINSNDGQIYVARNGTQFNDLESYLENFDQQTNLNVINESKYSVDGNDAVSRIFENTDVSGSQEKIFFIFINNSVYKISTTEESLFDDLDQIAQSFKYTGD